ncbi:hypothetical protein [Sandaracinobacteroides saxicola]|uniref:Uncharacterized protein n=1 Tax=Sandaracinobacteroides saxicola TaxID=2759707 RepID=A0A7G5IGV9_9SPHN|nr:hypothetical protein [Sandaracinobacteroides saxicola]QMW22601.1 hypothetical protein H3309_15000 [Sandaracinobacteroides saxicola]
MLGKIITALAGRSIARSVGGASAGPTGAIIGAVVPTVLPRIARRLGPVGMIAAAAGGYALTKFLENRRKVPVTPALPAPQSAAPPVAATPTPPA